MVELRGDPSQGFTQMSLRGRLAQGISKREWDCSLKKCPSVCLFEGNGNKEWE